MYSLHKPVFVFRLLSNTVGQALAAPFEIKHIARLVKGGFEQNLRKLVPLGMVFKLCSPEYQGSPEHPLPWLFCRSVWCLSIL